MRDVGPLYFFEFFSPYRNHWGSYPLTESNLQNNFPCLRNCQARSHFQSMRDSIQSFSTLISCCTPFPASLPLSCRSQGGGQNLHSLKLPLLSTPCSLVLLSFPLFSLPLFLGYSFTLQPSRKSRPAELILKTLLMNLFSLFHLSLHSCDLWRTLLCVWELG